MRHVVFVRRRKKSGLSNPKGRAIFSGYALREMVVGAQAGGDIYKELFERTGAVVFVIEPVSGRILMATQMACQFYGFDSEELIKKNIQDLYAEPGQNLFSGAEVVVAFQQHRKADGTILEVEVTWGVPDNRRCIVTIQDVTEKKQSQKNFEDAKASIQELFRISPVGMLVFRLDSGRAIEVNDACLEIIGYSREELINRTFKEFPQFMNIEGLARRMQELKQFNILHNMETVVQRKSGDSRVVISTMGSVRLFGDDFGLVLMVDISKQKQSEAALQALNHEMEERVLERTEALRTANLELQKALNVKNEFFAAISHELRTPLTGIIGLSQVLQMSTYGTLNDKQLVAVDNIHQSGLRLLKVLNDVLEYTLLQSGSVVRQVLHTSLETICRMAMKKAALLANAKRQQVHLNISSDQVIFSVDARRLDQVLDHLLGNASKFTPEGGDFGIQAMGIPAEKMVAITIWDNGIGMSATDFERIFEPFVQLDARLARMYEGTGLGLALAKQIVLLLGGRLQVQSEPGEGSRFTILLPWE